ncbi:MAG: sigma-54-dependent Fis family transcriptional regulator [Bacteroidetes bacterium]|nr:sigma-54-dependent Fis family transcriptional regulator [Bacteroidota bacterium]
MAKRSFSILVVDDEQRQRDVLTGYLRKQRYTVEQAPAAADALAVLARDHIDLVLTDMNMPGKSGHELLTAVRSGYPETDVVVMTAFGTIEHAVAAMRAGAYDFISKPIDLDALDLLLGRLQERRVLVSENRVLREQLAERFSFDGIISQSAGMQQVLQTAARVAGTRAPVLVRGESGTGKELIARAVHYASDRKDRPFISVNCAALNENLLESELFGHEKGAFTGAEKQRRGRFELADGGTLFLDEIGDISPATQVRLLRVLQEQTFERVGGSETLRVDVRVIAATHKHLETAITEGKFREDLFYRLNVVAVEIPPLRERRDDIQLLLDHFLRRFAGEYKRKHLAFSKEAWEALVRYDYPGNVRELENIVQRSVILSRGEIIAADDLPAALRTAPKGPVPEPGTGSFDEQVERLEQRIIFEALRAAGNNQSKAAEQIGISERTLRYKLKKWGVK